MDKRIVQLSIGELLAGSARYVIPMYQRNYAWDEGEITQLIVDVIDAMAADGADKVRDYYIGSLVVFPRGGAGRPAFEVIDGQQRLTTLSLLASWLRKKLPGELEGLDGAWIDFESRPRSQRALAAIWAATGADDDPIKDQDARAAASTAILNGYRLIQKIVPLKFEERGITLDRFATFLRRHVQIMRVEVPAETDLNHYFEVMNNRGEQLEKHEVLKARLLKVLQDIADETERRQSQACLHRVWEACANMEKYVQTAFSSERRTQLFGDDWDAFQVGNFDELAAALAGSVASDQGHDEQSLNQIISSRPPVPDRSDATGGDESPERFNSVIDFPNFLLHVLRVSLGADIPLDDKRLLDTFRKHVLKPTAPADPIGRVKQFAFDLLRCKYLYDHYVIKREFARGTDGWSLKRLKCGHDGTANRAARSRYVNTFGEDGADEGGNRRILMLLAAFHVSTPTLAYKHWLGAALHYLFTAERIEARAYLAHLESVAKAFFFDRFVAEEPAEYEEIVFVRKGACQARRDNVDVERLRHWLSFPNIRNNFVFNYLDYLLWCKASDGKTKRHEFTFRSSVEHHYPQTPLPGIAPLDRPTLDTFGNLCLISHSKNSRLSNFTPTAKKELKQGDFDSIKEYLMMQHAPWNADSIAAHEQQMLDVLLSSLDED
ncbi:MAG: DUF262 domain-containing protein [Rhodanobacteraceae bacterium]|jgi:hypothetical protein|nr:DUF262 domain-containing protein [Rhodanobacteraceae bacterium]